jgi:hypothetical protein
VFGKVQSHYTAYLLLLMFMLAESAHPGFARQQNNQPPELRLPRDILEDQEVIWTSPIHLKKHDLKWFLPFVVATAGLIVTDPHNSEALSGSDNDDLSLSHGVANAGFGIMAGAVGFSYLAGRWKHNPRAVETGMQGAEALADSAIVANLLKLGTNRRRPDAPGADGDLWSGGKGFPSNHSIMTWSAASVIAERYPGRPLLRFGSYSIAAAVSLTRVTGKNHYPSDALVGAVFGYLIGRYVARHCGGP